MQNTAVFFALVGSAAGQTDFRFGDRSWQDAPTTLGTFCANMTDSLFVDGAANPRQLIEYELCLDTSKKSYRRTDPGIGVEIHNGTHLLNINATTSKCTVKLEAADVSGMPWSMPVLDASATANGTATVDGEKTTVYTVHRAPKHEGSMFQPAEDMFWYVRDGDGALVQSKCVIAKQDGYPMSTVAYHDYFARGTYEASPLPAGTFAPPDGVDCKEPAHMIEKNATEYSSCKGCVDSDVAKCCAETDTSTPFCLKTTSCDAIPAL